LQNDNLQNVSFERYTVDYAKIPVLFNLQRNFLKGGDSALFSFVLSAGASYKLIYNSEIFNGQEILEDNDVNTFGVLGTWS